MHDMEPVPLILLLQCRLIAEEALSSAEAGVKLSHTRVPETLPKSGLIPEQPSLVVKPV